MHVRSSKYGVSNQVAEQRLDRSSSHRRHIQLLEYQHVRRSRLDSMFYTSFHSLPPPTLQGHVRGAMRYRRECQQVIDKAYATKCNRSEESRASRIAAHRRDNRSNRIIIPGCSSPILRALDMCDSSRIIPQWPVSLLATRPPKAGALMRLRDLPSHYYHGGSTKSG
jgi:hypothetical protein